MAARGWYSGDTHTHRTLDELPNVMLAEDLNVAFPLTRLGPRGVRPADRRAARRRSATPGPTRSGSTRRTVIVPRNTEYEIFTVGKARHTLGAFFVLNHKTPLDLGVPPVGPVAGRAHREGALIELDKHNWPWSMALVPIMPVDLFELSNNHVWQTEFAFRDFGEPPAAVHERRARREGLHRAGLDRLRLPELLRPARLRLPPAADGRDRLGRASGAAGLRPGVRPARRGPRRATPGSSGLNAGRSFVTTGPMLLVTLDGHDPGHRFEPADAAAREYRLRGLGASARAAGADRGRDQRRGRPDDQAGQPRDRRGPYESPIDESLTIDGTSWVAVRCFEDRPDGRVRFAHSGPFHVDVAGRPLRPRRAEVEYLVHRVEAQIDRSADVLPRPALDEYREALGIYRKLLETAR